MLKYEAFPSLRLRVSDAHRMLLLLLLAPAFLLVSCEKQADTDLGPANTHLTPCTSCEQLEDYVKNSALQMLGDFYGNPDGCYRLLGLPGEPPRNVGFPGPSFDKEGSGGGYSTTNIQEAGVDEPDFVKNDGENIYLLNGSRLLIYAATPPEHLRELSRTSIEGIPSQMLVAGDKAVVFSDLWGGGVYGGQNGGATEPSPSYGLKITILDIGNKSDPRMIRETYIEGWFSTARLIENHLHVVVSGYLKFPEIDYSAPMSKNRKIIEQTPLESWLPRSADVLHQGGRKIRSEDRLLPCEGFYLPDGVEMHNLLSILSFDLENPLSGPSTASVPSPASTVYASPESIFVSHQDISEKDCSTSTRIHKFDIHTDPGVPTYAGSGLVAGWLLNSFSLGEKDGYLRVATTESGGPMEEAVSSNNLFVMQQAGAELDILGEIRGIAPGEQIYSARFLGDVGFMVTYKQIDPLFTFDLSDPYKPELVGELEVPGYSSYIHPAPDGHLLTMGRDTDDQGNFAWFEGVHCSLYDISDLSAPRLTQMEILGTRGTNSEALYDHKAFNYYEPKNLLAFPLELYEGDQDPPEWGRLTFSGFYVYDVNLSQGFVFRGRISHDDFYRREPCRSFKAMRRTIIIGDSLYTVSSAGMKAHSVDDLSVRQASVAFPTCGQDGYTYPIIRGGETRP